MQSTAPIQGTALERRRLLVLAHVYPPAGGAAVQRTAKMVKYLTMSGWRVSVVTADPSTYGILDSSHPEEPGVEVVRTACFDPFVRFARSPNGAHAAGTLNGPPRTSLRFGARAVARSVWVELDRHLLIPDRFILWYPHAVRAALRLHRRAPFDVIYATGDPYSSFLIARRVASVARVPFVLDMRDPWTLVPYRQDSLPRHRAARERRLERAVLDECAACIFANRAIDAYAEAYPEWSHKFHYVPNGFDPDDFRGVEPRRFDRFTIVHNGSFLPGYRTADTFLSALAQLLKDTPGLRRRLQVMFIGKIGEERALSERLGIQDIVHHVGYVAHRDSLSYVLGADLLLLVGGNRRWEETGKIFEYLAAAKPILGLVEEAGTAAELLRRASTVSPRVVTVGRQSVSKTVNELRAFLEVSSSRYEPPAWLAEYRRDVLADRIAAILQSACAQASALCS